MEDEKRELETKVEEESADSPETEQSTTSAVESEETATAETSADAPAETANEPAKVICPKCGAENDATLAYCPKCGTKLEGAKAEAAKPEPAPEVSLDQFVAEQKADEPKKLDAKAWFAKNKVLAIVAAVVIVVLGALIIPPMLATPDDLFEQGKYEEAYNKSAEEDKPAMLARICGTGDFQTAYDLAPDEETKTDILFANIIANQCADVADGLKDPSSFKLRDAYIDRSTGQFALEVSGANSYGATVTNYYLYSVNKTKNGYTEYYVSDLEEETYYRFDTSSELTEKLINNATRSVISDLMSKGSNKLDDGYVDAINSLFESDGLDSVSLLDDVSSIYNLKS